MPVKVNLPSASLTAEYFFPVSVLEAVTVAPGRGVFPLRAVPVISYVGGGALCASACTGPGGAGLGCVWAGVESCACRRRARSSASKAGEQTPRRIDFN